MRLRHGALRGVFGKRLILGTVVDDDDDENRRKNIRSKTTDVRLTSVATSYINQNPLTASTV